MFVSRKVLQDFQISVLSRYQLSVSLITDSLYPGQMIPQTDLMKVV